MGVNIKEANDWVRDNGWMVFFWVLNAKHKQTNRMQEFTERQIVELNQTNRGLSQNDTADIYRNLMKMILREVVFGRKYKFPVCIEGYYSKFGKYPKVGDVQLYYTNPQQINNKSGDPQQRAYQNNISVLFDWEFINGS